jgi:methionine synthase I (cobalamin-dependent)
MLHACMICAGAAASLDERKFRDHREQHDQHDQHDDIRDLTREAARFAREGGTHGEPQAFADRKAAVLAGIGAIVPMPRATPTPEDRLHPDWCSFESS